MPKRTVRVIVVLTAIPVVLCLCIQLIPVWLAYARVAPVSWLITLDTVRGRRHLNFSEVMGFDIG